MARPRSRTTDFVEQNGVIVFPLTQGLTAKIDSGDAWILADKWYAVEVDSNFYAATQRNGRRVMLHLEIAKPLKGIIVDHFNGDSLDDRRWNLRLCTLADNAVNVTRLEDAGISWDADRSCWFASIKWRRQRYYVGRFHDHTEAVLATQAKRQSLMDADPYFQGETGATDHSFLRAKFGAGVSP